MDIGESNWFLGIPVIIVILLNIIFLSNVVYILRSKLNPESSQQAIMKQARATMFLVPILGVNYLLVPIRPAEGSWLEDVYDILVVLFSAFQGAFVSLLLCFTNCEVLVLIKRRWKQQMSYVNPQEIPLCQKKPLQGKYNGGIMIDNGYKEQIKL